MADTAVPSTTDSKSTDVKKYLIDIQKPAVTTTHKLGKLEYTVTTGYLPIQDALGEPEAGMFYTAYVKKGGKDASSRPLMFTFNGGPGSSSVWLHLGAVGPKRVKMLPSGEMPAPPYELVDNPHNWLEHADLVFIDPIGTGFSRSIKQEDEKKFWSLEGDIASIGEFIRLYLSRNHRWSSPLYLAGESYGTTRAAGLSGYLVDKGITFNGIILVSSILNFQTARFTRGNDLPYSLFFPTYTATAWYHEKLPKDLQKDLSKALKEAEQFAANEYVLALQKGDSLTEAEREVLIKKLARLTGLSPSYLENTDLRINIHQFCKELLRSEKRTVGRLDSRYKGIDGDGVAADVEHDPSMTAIMGPYTAMINDYLRRELGWETDMPYHVFNPGELWAHWTYGDAAKGYPDTSEALRAAMSKNPYMKVFVASGYYDIATPYFATEYTLNHMGLDASVRGNISTHYYKSGHMMYVEQESIAKLKADISTFMNRS